MASAKYLTYEEERELKRAVLHELTRSLNGSTDAPTFDIQHLIDNSEYQTDAEKEMEALEDDDWRDIKKPRNDQSLPSDGFVRLYDEMKETMYYVDIGSPGRARLEVETHDHSTSASIDLSSAESKSEAFERPDVDEVLNRLILENGRFGPRGYQKWMTRKLKSRFPVKNDLPGFATLCDRCHRVLTNSLTFYKRVLRQSVTEHVAKAEYVGPHVEVFGHHETTEALRASASAKCHLCSLINGPDADGMDSGTCKKEHNTSYFLEFSHAFLTMHPIGCPNYNLYFSNEFLEAGSSTLKYANTNAPEVIQLARTWLTRCLREDNKRCSMSTDYLPTRLIEITAMNGSLESARLILRDELPMDARYLTLSHCWGGLEMVRLEKSTFNKYRTDIPLLSLSKTFREALQVTVWLEYQYIWIDSLCIQQDSDPDWEREAARMGAIYRHSTCTIAATGARNGDAGLFFERSALAFTKCPLVRAQSKELHAHRFFKWPAPLSSRAWAVQERFLSQRTLSFGSDRISWSCRRTEACEGAYADCLELGPFSFPRLLDRDTDAVWASRAWEEVVAQYSRCKLTLWKDKWPAFQGLASEVAKAQNWTIVHGLRHHVLGIELLWQVRNPELGTIELGEPSWSWLNIKGGTLYDAVEGEHLDAKIVLQDLSAPTDIREATGDISDGVIQIEACMSELRTSLPEDYYSMWCTLAVTNPMFQLDDPDRLLRGWWYPDTIPIYDGDLWAIQVMWILPWKRKKGDYLSKGLVVAAVEGRPGFWRRIGVYDCDWFVDLDTEDSDADTLDDDESDIDDSDTGTLGEDESTTDNRYCPWNREKTTIYLI